MASDENQRQVFDYLLARLRDQRPFEKIEVQEVTSWSESSFDTYWSKQLKHFFVPVPGKAGKFRVGEAFRPYASWERFRQHVTQVRRVSSDYTSLVHDNIIVFEFFMPLANEEHLRTSLDALFYKDAILTRLRSVGRQKIEAHFPISADVSEDEYLDKIATWIGSRFGGYSISHVSGRFRAGPTVTVDEAAEIQKNGARYLIDETTAIVRFIFPCGKASRREPPLSPDTFEEAILYEGAIDADAVAEATKIRWAFGVLFVQSIVQVVNGEAEIWMVESGMRSRLHIWKVESVES